MKTYTYDTILKRELDTGMRKLVTDGIPFSFMTNFLGPTQHFNLKVRLGSKDSAEKLWKELNGQCNYAFSLGYRR